MTSSFSSENDLVTFVGDVHGCYDELIQLFSVLPKAAKGRVVFLGDVINRGPKSQQVLDFIFRNSYEAICGNHELGFINYVQDRRHEPESQYETLKQQLGTRVDEYVLRLQSWPLYIEGDDWIAVHAGIAPDHPIHEQSARVLTRIRTWDGTGEGLGDDTHPAWHELYSGPKTVVYGHWAMQGLQVKQHSIGLDTGCVWGGQLTALIWPHRDIIQVPALKAYSKISYRSEKD